VEARSAGVDPDAPEPLTRELLEWAELVFVMEKRQRNRIRKAFPELYARKRIICLYIPDQYDRMDPVLVRLLREGVEPHLPAG
jgi:predicted protein tyrosine phosphatase